MKKITFFLFFLLTSVMGMNAQCINENQYPENIILSNNLGTVQVISNANFTSDYAEIHEIIPGEDYIFSCKWIDPDAGSNLQNRYITVTNLSNEVIAFGPSPLTVTAITADKIRVHFSDNAACGSTYEDHITTLQIVTNCPSPLNILVSDITTESANFTWSAGGSETSWQVIIQAADIAPPMPTTAGLTVNSTNYSYSSLSAASNYRFYVRANCGSEFSPWTYVPFASACIPIASFNESFDLVASDFPNCWSSILRGETLSEYAHVSIINESINSAPNSVELFNDGSDTSGGDDVILVSPNLSTLVNGTYRLKFYAKNEGSLQIGTLDTNSSTATFHLIEEIATTNTSTQYTVNFTGYTGTDKHIGIRLNLDEYGTIQVDDILWEPIPSCDDITDITVPEITPNGARIDWTPGGDEVSWDIAVGTVSVSDPNTLTYVSSETNTKEITGLVDNTAYKVWVRSVCSGNDNGAWIGPVLFKSDCIAVSNFYETFDSADTPNVPSCWTTILRGDTLSEYAYIETNESDYAHSSPNVVEFYKSDSNTEDNHDDIILVSPNLSTLGNGTHRLKFYARGYEGRMQVGTLDTNTDTGFFTPLETITVNETMLQYTVDFAAYTGTDRYIGIRMNNHEDQGYELYIDDMLWELLPTCPDVTAITVSTVSTNSATIQWSTDGPEESWDIAIGAPTVNEPSALAFVSSASLSKEVTGLEENTDYRVWVRSVCGSDDKGSWIGPIPFRTDCPAVATLNENFDTANTPDLPSCWSKILRGPTLTQYSYIKTIDYQVSSSPTSVVLFKSDSDTNGEDDIILVSPNLSTVFDGSHRLKFSARGESGLLQVGTMSSNTSTGVFSPIEEIVTTDMPAQYTVDFAPYVGPNRYVAFRVNSVEDYNSIGIDDILWETTPSCADVTEVTIASVSPQGAEISWTAGGAEVSWDIAVGATTVTDPNTLPFVSSTVPHKTIIGLETATTYKTWVRSVCTGNDQGAWIGPVLLKTDCMPVTEFNENFDDSDVPNLPTCWRKIVRGANISEYDAVETTYETVHSGALSVSLHTYDSNPTGTDDLILISPNLSNLVNGTHRLKFYAKGPGSIQVGTMSSNTPTATFNLIEEFETTDTATLIKANFTSYTGSDRYVGIRLNNDEDFTSVFIDDVIWEEAPLCADVEDIEVNNFTTTTADIGWTAGGTEGNWQLVYGDLSVTDPDTLTPQPAVTTTNSIITGLLPDTAYNVWVRSVCGNNSGAWIGPITFSTACIAATITVTAIEDFETTPNGDLPTCWHSVLVSGQSGWRTVTPEPFDDVSTAHSGTKIVYKPYSNSNALLYSSPYDYSSVSTATRVNTYLHRSEFSAPNDKYVIYANTVPSLEGAVELLEVYSDITVEPQVNITGFYNYTADIPASFNGVPQVYIIVQGSTIEGWQSLGLGMDDFKVEFTALGTGDLDKNDFIYYPNPVRNILNLSYNKPISTVMVSNLLGQKVIVTTAVNSTTAQIDMSSLPSGSYIVKVSSDNETKTMKVIKQ